MQSKAKTVKGYLASLPEDRRPSPKVIEAVDPLASEIAALVEARKASAAVVCER